MQKNMLKYIVVASLIASSHVRAMGWFRNVMTSRVYDAALKHEKHAQRQEEIRAEYQKCVEESKKDQPANGAPNPSLFGCASKLRKRHLEAAKLYAEIRAEKGANNVIGAAFEEGWAGGRATIDAVAGLIPCSKVATWATVGNYALTNNRVRKYALRLAEVMCRSNSDTWKPSGEVAADMAQSALASVAIDAVVDYLPAERVPGFENYPYVDAMVNDGLIPCLAELLAYNGAMYAGNKMRGKDAKFYFNIWFGGR